MERRRRRCNINYVSYTSENGYTGVMYSKSSFIVYNPDNEEVFHTGFRTFDTFEELREQVDTFPEFYDMLIKYYPAIITNEEGEENA